MAKDGCNNMEKNRILTLFNAGNTVPDIATGMRLTERIVESITSHYRPDSVESKPKSKKKVKKKAEAKNEFKDFD